MLIGSGFSWFHLAGLADAGMLHGEAFVVASAWLASLLAIGFAFAARGELNKAIARGGIAAYEPSQRFGALTIAETVIGGFKGLMESMMDAKYVRAFLPLVAGIAIFIFACNVQGLLPGFLPPTDNLSMNVGIAITVMVSYIAVGLFTDAKGFAKHIIGPVWWLAPLFIPLELLTYLGIRPFSLSVRLAANMFGDHQVFLIMSELSQSIPGVGILAGAVVPIAFLVLGLLVCTIQAGVFALLTTVYISMSLPHGHDDHGHGEGHPDAHH
jgi:F-type H+-transporting ATPase subunit a